MKVRLLVTMLLWLLFSCSSALHCLLGPLLKNGKLSDVGQLQGQHVPLPCSFILSSSKRKCDENSVNIRLDYDRSDISSECGKTSKTDFPNKVLNVFCHCTEDYCSHNIEYLMSKLSEITNAQYFEGEAQEWAECAIAAIRKASTTTTTASSTMTTTMKTTTTTPMTSTTVSPATASTTITTEPLPRTINIDTTETPTTEKATVIPMTDSNVRHTTVPNSTTASTVKGTTVTAVRSTHTTADGSQQQVTTNPQDQKSCQKVDEMVGWGVLVAVIGVALILIAVILVVTWLLFLSMRRQMEDRLAREKKAARREVTLQVTAHYERLVDISLGNNVG